MTEAEIIQFYGADAAEWLRRWDAGEIVWSIEMGGLGPGYEQCIQITTAEILRHMLDKKYDASKWSDQQSWDKDYEQVKDAGFKNDRIVGLGLSGAQWGAAVHLAHDIYKNGPVAVMKRYADAGQGQRRIQVRRNFPA